MYLNTGVGEIKCGDLTNSRRCENGVWEEESEIRSKENGNTKRIKWNMVKVNKTSETVRYKYISISQCLQYHTISPRLSSRLRERSGLTLHLMTRVTAWGPMGNGIEELSCTAPSHAMELSPASGNSSYRTDEQDRKAFI